MAFQWNYILLCFFFSLIVCVEELDKWILLALLHCYVLQTGKAPIKDMFSDLRDGRKLLDLLEGLTGNTLVRACVCRVHTVCVWWLGGIESRVMCLYLALILGSTHRVFEWQSCRLQCFILSCQMSLLCEVAWCYSGTVNLMNAYVIVFITSYCKVELGNYQIFIY